MHAGHALTIPLHRHYEHALLVLAGDCTVEGRALDHGLLFYLGMAREELRLHSREGGRVLLIGGPPFPEPILMWWNFVARTPEEIRDAREDWQSRRRFGEVPAYAGPRLDAPALVRFARPNPMS